MLSKPEIALLAIGHTQSVPIPLPSILNSAPVVCASSTSNVFCDIAKAPGAVANYEGSDDLVISSSNRVRS